MTAAAHKTLFVMAAVSDPVGQGLIASYPHPGGKITGTASQFEDLAAKMFQLLHETAPNAGSIAVLFNPRNPVHKVFLAEIEAANRLFGLKLATFQIGQLDHLATAFDDMRSAGVDAMVLPDDSYLFNLRHISRQTDCAAPWPSVSGVGIRRGSPHVRHETTGVHHAARRRGGCVAACGARAAASDAGGRIPQQPIA